MASKQVNASKIVGECYDKYLVQADKQKKINDVKGLLEKLCENGFIEERFAREYIEFDSKEMKAAAWVAPAVERGECITSGFNETTEKQLKEISGYASTKITLVIRTKEGFRRDDEKRNYFIAERLRELGFEVHSWSEKTEMGTGEIEWIEAKKVLLENDTAEAVLYVLDEWLKR